MQTTRAAAARLALRGFTIVELLVTVAVIAVLMGILITGVRGALGSARKTKELNGLRGVYAAWSQYATTYDEQLLPGYLDTATQTAWKVSYPDINGTTLAAPLTQTYPWRLARFMDNPVATFTNYYDSDGDEMSEPSLDWESGPTRPAWMDQAFGQPSSLVSLQPAFSMNAYYVGGWYEGSAGAGATTPRFADARWTSSSNGAQTGGLVATRLSHIQHTDLTILFAGGTLRAPGKYVAATNPEDRVLGNAWIVPPMLGQTNVWEPSMGDSQQGVNVGMAGGLGGVLAFLAPQATDTGVLQVNVNEGVPCRRYNGLVATVTGDGHVESQSIGALMDMRRWIEAADGPDFTHQDN